MKKCEAKHGERLKEARKAIGLTQKELSEEIHFSVDSIRGWENNRSQCKNHDVLQFLSEKSGFTIDYLTGKSFIPYADKDESDSFATQQWNLMREDAIQSAIETLTSYRLFVIGTAESIECKLCDTYDVRNGVDLNSDDTTLLFDLIRNSIVTIVDSFYRNRKKDTYQNN